jgi:hypothetical protein
MTKIAGSGSGSISQRPGSADPDPHQNVLNQLRMNVIFLRLRVCGAGEGGGAVAGQVRRGPALPHQEEPGRSHFQAYADIQGNTSTGSSLF